MPEKDHGGRLFIHLDPLGGVAGDMFVAAVLDAFPELEGEVRSARDALKLGPDGDRRLEAHNDGTLVGRRFIVGALKEAFITSTRPPGGHRPKPHAHGPSRRGGERRG